MFQEFLDLILLLSILYFAFGRSGTAAFLSRSRPRPWSFLGSVMDMVSPKPVHDRVEKRLEMRFN